MHVVLCHCIMALKHPGLLCMWNSSLSKNRNNLINPSHVFTVFEHAVLTANHRYHPLRRLESQKMLRSGGLCSQMLFIRSCME